MAITKVTNRVLADNSVGVAQLSAGAVTSAKIADSAVTPTKLSTGAPTWNTSGEITVGNTINAKIFDAGGAGINIGKVRLVNGSSTNAGYIEWYRPNGTTRMGYMGYGNGTNIQLVLENGSDFNITGGPLNIGSPVKSETAGYINLPNGYIIQYGIRNGNGRETITLPISFPTNQVAILVTDGGATPTQTSARYSFGTYGLSLNQINIDGPNLPYTCSWMVIGY